MDVNFTQFIPELAVLLIAGGSSTYITSRISQALIKERVDAVKSDFAQHKEDSFAEFARFKEDILASISSCKSNHRDRIDDLVEYIKRVELNKADKSEFNLVYDNLKRVEQKLDLLILRKDS